MADQRMRYGAALPGGTAAQQLEQAVQAEAAGWDATPHQLSGGRAILAVGVGALGDELPDTGEVTDLRTRAPNPDDVRALRAWLAEHDAPAGLDVVVDGETPAQDRAAAAEVAGSWADAGATWWVESRWGMPDSTADRIRQMTERLAAGPPAGRQLTDAGPARVHRAGLRNNPGVARVCDHA